jgi:hypothetical protein
MLMSHDDSDTCVYLPDDFQGAKIVAPARPPSW